MNTTDQTIVTFFTINGISEIPELRDPISLLILFIYLMTLGGNMTILLLVCLDPQLHTPMYFFLCNLSIMDMASSTVTLHKVLVIFLTGDNTVSFLACMAQMFIFTSLVCNELLVLTAMSYDRYVAICNPLHYSMIMRRRVCVQLAIVCWVLGSLESLPHVIILSKSSCYRSKEINHFFCDILPLVKLTCSNTSLSNLLVFVCGLFLSVFPFIFTVIPYVFIIATIMKIRSGKHKAFYTCCSHLTVIILLYVTLMCQYLRPMTMDSLDSNKLFSLFNTAVVPMLNPLIYSLKNKDVKSALRRRWCKTDFLSSRP
ncbi:olfactory receptor 8D1-like [Rhinophrynus dorsalis]